jgi:hypothetical protein
MARTLRSGLALLLTAALALTIAGRFTQASIRHAHTHNHLHPLPADGDAPDDPVGDAAIDKLLAGSTKSSQSANDVGLVFNLSKLTDPQKRWARTILSQGCSYDWQKLIPSLSGRKIKIQIGNPSARAMFYPAELRLVIHRYYYRSERADASRLLGWETAHAVDLLSLDEEQRADITDLYHADTSDDHGWLYGSYEHQVGEAFMEGFVAAFCPTLSTDPLFSHETSPEIAEGIRSELS